MKLQKRSSVRFQDISFSACATENNTFSYKLIVGGEELISYDTQREYFTMNYWYGNKMSLRNSTMNSRFVSKLHRKKEKPFVRRRIQPMTWPTFYRDEPAKHHEANIWNSTTWLIYSKDITIKPWNIFLQWKHFNWPVL